MKLRFSKILISVSCVALGLLFMCGCVVQKRTPYEWVVQAISKYYYEDIPEDELRERIIKEGVAGVLDIYSAYYTKEEYAQLTSSNAGNKSGMGISYQYLPSGMYDFGEGVYVTAVAGGSPAYESGIKAGMFITGVKVGEDTITFGSKDEFTDFISSAAEGQPITYITDRGEFDIARCDYKSSYCRMSTSQASYSFYYENGERKIRTEEEGISCLPDGAAYLKLDQFYGDAVEEFSELIGLYNRENCSSLILDLRRNGGGYVDVMCGISGIFAGELGKTGTVAMSARFKDGTSEDFYIKDVPSDCYFPAGDKLTVLADNGTASASEALIGVLISLGVIDYGDIYISDFTDEYLAFSGTAAKDCRTYGKGIMQSVAINPDTGDALKLTTAHIYWPNGKCIHGVGLTGEECNTLEAEWCVTYGDAQLARAVERIYSAE